MAKLRTRSWRGLTVIMVVTGVIWGVIYIQKYEPQLGLDLQGGISVALIPEDPNRVPEGALDKAVDIIRERVDAFGVAEPDITVQGDTIIVQIAGIQPEDQERALALIGSTAKLSFRPVLGPARVAEQLNEGLPERQQIVLPTCGERDTYSRDDPDRYVVFCYQVEGERYIRYTLGPSELTGDLVRRASPQLDPSGQIVGWFVSMDFTSRGGDLFGELTGQLAGQQPPMNQLAISLDGEIRSAPRVNEAITGGKAIVEGIGIESEARDLALVLRYGSLPIELEPADLATVSPTLGRESLRNGLLAGLMGVILLFFYVLIFYRALGLVIWIGLVVHAALTFGLIILLGAVAGFSVTLAGIAGLIVSVGIATDSFVVYFERIRDEVRSGRQARAAIERGWESARRTIIAADLVTALAAIVLYMLAVGGVRGFALMLGLAITLDIVVSFMVMHPMVHLLGQTRFLKGSRVLKPVPASGVA